MKINLEEYRAVEPGEIRLGDDVLDMDFGEYCFLETYASENIGKEYNPKNHLKTYRKLEKDIDKLDKNANINEHMEILGYRKLKNGEIIQKDDIIYHGDKKIRIYMQDYKAFRIGKPYEQINHFETFRKIENDIIPLPIEVKVDFMTPAVIPYGLIELNDGQIIRATDIAYDYHNKKFIIEKYIDNNATGQPYKSGAHFRTYRKVKLDKNKKNVINNLNVVVEEINKDIPIIDDNEDTVNINRYRYFTSRNAGAWGINSAFIASKDGMGYLFRIDGKVGGTDPSYQLSNAIQNSNYGSREWKEITFKEAIEKIIDNKEYKLMVYNYLGIKPYKPKPVTPEEIDNILSIIKQNRAFNADSAYKFDNSLINICFELKEKNILGEYKNRFFLIKKDFENIKVEVNNIAEKTKVIKNSEKIEEIW